MKRRIGSVVLLAMMLFMVVVIPVQAATQKEAQTATQTETKEDEGNSRTDLFKVFGPNGGGWAITQLVVLVIGGSASSMLAAALGKGNIAAYIKLLTTLGSIGIVIKEISKQALAVFGLLGY